jgi:hypothetical protein
MTLKEAAAFWLEAKRAKERYEPQLKEAAEILLEWFRRTKRGHYKGLVGYALTQPKILDQSAAKRILLEIGRLEECMVRRPREQLSPLGD